MTGDHGRDARLTHGPAGSGSGRAPPTEEPAHGQESVEVASRQSMFGETRQGESLAVGKDQARGHAELADE